MRTVPQPATPAPLTALVVDDSITMRRVTQRLLERRGAKVHTARDGLDAITVLQEHTVDVILLDIEMPRMDGYQFATHVRNDPKVKHLPIIMITSRSGEKHRAKAIEIGVNDYLSKPYQESQLIAAIAALLGGSSNACIGPEQKELYSLLIPLQNERLLVPRMCVAEVIAFADAARSRDDAAPDWFLGAIEWNNRRVPVVSFDAGKGRSASRSAAARASWSFMPSRKSSRAAITGFSRRASRSSYVSIRTFWGSNGAAAPDDFSGAVPRADDPRVPADPRRRASREDDRRNAAARLTAS